MAKGRTPPCSERRVLRRQDGFDHPGGDFFEGYPDTILLKESRQKLAVAIKDVGGEVGLSLDDLVGGRQGGAELLDIESPPNRGPRKGHGSHEEQDDENLHKAPCTSSFLRGGCFFLSGRILWAGIGRPTVRHGVIPPTGSLPRGGDVAILGEEDPFHRRTRATTNYSINCGVAIRRKIRRKKGSQACRRADTPYPFCPQSPRGAHGNRSWGGSKDPSPFSPQEWGPKRGNLLLRGLARFLRAWYSVPCRRSKGGEQAPCQQNTAHKKFSSQCFCKLFMESLILAQDERWRRA